jgi:hypothetical protein
MENVVPARSVEELTRACVQALQEVLPHVDAQRLGDPELSIRVAFELDAARAFLGQRQSPRERRKLAALELFAALEARRRVAGELEQLRQSGGSREALRDKRVHLEYLTRKAAGWAKAVDSSARS